MISNLITSNGLKTAIFLAEIGNPDGMMKNPIGTVIVRIRTSTDAYNREILTVRAGNCVDHTEASEGEGDDAGTDAALARVSVGGVAGVELVAAADVVEAGLGDEVVEEREVEVSGDGEDVGDADLDEAARQVAAEGALLGGGDRGGCGLERGDGAVAVGAADVAVGGVAGIDRADLSVHWRERKKG